ncbi:hypothetical protein A4X13_0g6050 [Tilletia indica]|uniref:Uncharacterized protein n=1 Tax=Tilletia indica TaxID=43049 RepID=A0A177T787_9BASI|nr:hypothetical protein A4X13_0g6050 [Tilletia indica]
MPSTPTASGSGRSAEDETPSSTSPSSSHGIDTTLYRRMFNSDLEFGTCLRVLRSVALQLGFDPGFASLVQRHLHSPEPPTQPPSLTHREEMALSPFRRFEYVDTRLGIWIRDLQQAGEELGFDPNWPSMIARHLNITPTAPPSAASPSATDPPLWVRVRVRGLGLGG